MYVYIRYKLIENNKNCEGEVREIKLKKVERKND